MPKKPDFLEWVSDPARTNDELFTVEMLLERARGHDWPFDFVDHSFDAQRERTRARRLNPGHRPALHMEELEYLLERGATMKGFSGGPMDDRPLRNLDALRFFPALENVNVQSSDVTDLRPLASLKKVQYLSIAEYGDLYGCHPLCLAECGEMPALKRVHLALRHPWPDLRALGNWQTLEDVNFAGNVLALEDLPAFASARVVSLKNWPGERVALRDLRRLPDMPKARQWTLATTASLEGIERYQRVVNLDVEGCFRDLTPLATMDNITAVTLRSEQFHDLRPLAEMKRLREIKFVREWPLDLSPLADCAQLRRVEIEHCAMMRMEVAALNAGLLPEAIDFQAEKPRPLGPLKFYRLMKGNAEGAEAFFRERQLKFEAEREKFYDGDLAFQNAEKRSFAAAMQAKFDALLGRGWGLFNLPYVSVKRFQDTSRTQEFVQLVREYSAQCRWPQPVTFIIEPHGDMSEDLEEMKAREAKVSAPDGDFLMPYYDPEQVLEENAEGRRAREERYELLKREHLRRLRGEEAGDLVYAAEEEPEEPAEEDEEENEESLTTEDDDEGEGGVAIAPPPPAPPEAGASISDDLMFYLEVHEECVVANSHWADRAEYTLGVQFVPWTAEDAAALN